MVTYGMTKIDEIRAQLGSYDSQTREYMTFLLDEVERLKLAWDNAEDEIIFLRRRKFERMIVHQQLRNAVTEHLALPGRTCSAHKTPEERCEECLLDRRLREALQQEYVSEPLARPLDRAYTSNPVRVK